MIIPIGLVSEFLITNFARVWFFLGVLAHVAGKVVSSFAYFVTIIWIILVLRQDEFTNVFFFCFINCGRNIANFEKFFITSFFQFFW
jgi:hypothetical protein